MILYGIPTCDSCRRALKTLRGAGREVKLRDIRADPLGPDDWRGFLDSFGEKLINRASATWRGMSEAERTAGAAQILAAHPTVMKRPVIRDGEVLHLGWGKDVQLRLLGTGDDG